MLSDRIFRNAFIFSVIAHIALFYNWPPLRNLSILKTAPPKQIEVTYQPSRTAPVFSELIDEKERIVKTAPPRIEKAESPAVKTQEMPRPQTDLTRPEKPQIEKLSIKGIEEDANILPEEAMLISDKVKDFSNEPTYLNYYNAVRAKIYKAANADKPSYYMEGDVKVVFTLADNGRLIDTAVVNKGSTTNPTLRNHALMSIKKASPFPPFHVSMKERELTLRITISFER